eukprot:1425937-Pyramimonas_sp.AAC.1
MQCKLLRGAANVCDPASRQLHCSRKHPNLPPANWLQNPCGGDCDDCLALAGASLRPHWRAQARAQSGQLVWRNRCGRDSAYGWQRPSVCQRPR